MNAKTERQIANLKQQTFGVEVEGNNITRQKAAQTATEYFGTGRFEYTAARNGYMTWSAWDSENREWKFQRDVSIKGPDDEKCELVTPVLTYRDMETFQGLLRTLRHAGMKSSPSRGCGVHIHVGLKGLDGRNHNAKTLRNLVNIMAAHEEQIGRAIKIDEGRTGHYCKVVNPDFLERVNRQKPRTMQKLADCWYEGNGATYGRSTHYNESRYHMINLHAAFTKGTVEFRLFQFSDPANGRQNGIHAGEMKAYIQVCLAMSELAKEVAYASPRPQQTDNEKYAMRCWMLRLGFITLCYLRIHLFPAQSRYTVLNTTWRGASQDDLQEIRRDCRRPPPRRCCTRAQVVRRCAGHRDLLQEGDVSHSKVYSYRGSYADVLNRLGIKVITQTDVATAEAQLRMAKEAHGKPGLFTKKTKDCSEEIEKLTDLLRRYRTDEFVRDWE